MVKETTTVKELMDQGYEIHAADQTAERIILTQHKCPECGALLAGFMDVLSCTECNYEKHEWIKCSCCGKICSPKYIGGSENNIYCSDICYSQVEN